MLVFSIFPYSQNVSKATCFRFVKTGIGLKKENETVSSGIKNQIALYGNVQ